MNKFKKGDNVYAFSEFAVKNIIGGVITDVGYIGHYNRRPIYTIRGNIINETINTFYIPENTVFETLDRCQRFASEAIDQSAYLQKQHINGVVKDDFDMKGVDNEN